MYKQPTGASRIPICHLLASIMLILDTLIHLCCKCLLYYQAKVFYCWLYRNGLVHNFDASSRFLMIFPDDHRSCFLLNECQTCIFQPLFYDSTSVRFFATTITAMWSTGPTIVTSFATRTFNRYFKLYTIVASGRVMWYTCGDQRLLPVRYLLTWPA